MSDYLTLIETERNVPRDVLGAVFQNWLHGQHFTDSFKRRWVLHKRAHGIEGSALVGLTGDTPTLMIGQLDGVFIYGFTAENKGA